jgi:hypothetical protein
MLQDSLMTALLLMDAYQSIAHSGGMVDAVYDFGIAAGRKLTQRVTGAPMAGGEYFQGYEVDIFAAFKLGSLDECVNKAGEKSVKVGHYLKEKMGQVVDESAKFTTQLASVSEKAFAAAKRLPISFGKLPPVFPVVNKESAELSFAKRLAVKALAVDPLLDILLRRHADCLIRLISADKSQAVHCHPKENLEDYFREHRELSPNSGEGKSLINSQEMLMSVLEQRAPPQVGQFFADISAAPFKHFFKSEILYDDKLKTPRNIICPEHIYRYTWGTVFKNSEYNIVHGPFMVQKMVKGLSRNSIADRLSLLSKTPGVFVETDLLQWSPMCIMVMKVTLGCWMTLKSL